MHFLPHWLYEMNIVYYILNNIFLAVLLRSSSLKQQWTLLTYFMDLIDLFYVHWDIILCDTCVNLKTGIFQGECSFTQCCVEFFISACLCLFCWKCLWVFVFLFSCSASAWILSSSAVWAFRFESHQLQFCSSLPLTLLVRYSYQPPVLFISPSSHLSLFSLCLLQLSL